jgi:hypothetical protein
MRHSMATTSVAPTTFNEGCATNTRRAPRSDVRDFAVLAVFISAFMGAGYLALWKPLLAHLLP